MQLSLAEAKSLCGDPQSGFSWETSEEVLSLPPRFHTSVGQGIKQQLDSRVGFVCDRLGGTVMGHGKVCVVGDLGHIVDDSPYLNVKVRAEVLVFRPRVGSVLHGSINKIGKDHVGVLVHGQFNASLHMAEGLTSTLNKGDNVSFVVTRIHCHRGLLSLVGKVCDT